MASHTAKFAPGRLIRHRLFGYRGVVADVDATFQLSEEWYEQMARSRPPRDQPWYHVLVDEAEHTTYVAERNLVADESADRVRHPEIATRFGGFADGRYLPRETLN